MPNINPIVLKTVSGGGGGINYSVNVFTSSGTYTKPANLDYAYVLMVSGGGGGGSGRRGAAGTNRGGGRSSNGAAVFSKWFNSELNTSETVTVGVGGSGAAVITTNDTNGINGGGGGASNFKHSVTFEIIGGTGSGGSTFMVTQLSSSNGLNLSSNRYKVIDIYSNPFILGSTLPSSSHRVNDAGNSSNKNILLSNTCTGGNVNSSNVQFNSGGLAGFYDNTNTLIGEMTGTLPETNGVQPTDSFTFGDFFNKIFPWFDPLDLPQIVGRGGLGGGCGDLSGTIAGGNGADAIGYGAGGGGGGASTNGANSGAGGNGSPGIVIIINVLTS